MFAGPHRCPVVALMDTSAAEVYPKDRIAEFDLAHQQNAVTRGVVTMVENVVWLGLNVDRRGHVKIAADEVGLFIHWIPSARIVARHGVRLYHATAE